MCMIHCSTGLSLLQQQNARRAKTSVLLRFPSMNRAERRHQIRRDNLARIKRERYKTAAAMIEQLGDGFGSSYFSQLLRGHRGIGDDVADKIAERLNLPPGYLDIDLGDPSLNDAVAEFIATYKNVTPEGRRFLENNTHFCRESFGIRPTETGQADNKSA